MKKNDSSYGGCHHGQCEKLAKHTIVQGLRVLDDMSSTMVMDAFRAFASSLCLLWVNVQRRAQQH